MGIYIFLGPPGAGKGTLAKMYCARTGALHISTGDIFREELARESELGLRVRAILESGQLVNDEIVGEMVASRLALTDVRERGCLLDGFPRTLPQAVLLDDILAKLGLALEQVVLLHADRELLLKRLTARRVCPGCGDVFNVLFTPPKKNGFCDSCGAELVQRSDDTLETAVDRLAVYDRETAPLVDFYRDRGDLVTVDTIGTVDDNYRAFCQAMDLE